MRLSRKGRTLMPVQSAPISYTLHWTVDRELEGKLALSGFGALDPKTIKVREKGWTEDDIMN